MRGAEVVAPYICSRGAEVVASYICSRGAGVVAPYDMFMPSNGFGGTKSVSCP